MIKKILFLKLLITSILAFGEMPEPYCSIHDLPFDSQGWFTNQHQLDILIKAHKPVVVIEVGSWIGASTRFIADRLPKGGKLYAVDTWKGSPEEKVHMEDPRLPYLYQLFLSNTKHAGLTEVIVPVRMESLEAAEALNVMADLIYIDAAHDEQSVYNDIMAWYPHLKKGGVFCGDDWGWGTVSKAVMRAADELNLKIFTDGWFWSFY